jgi:hypothetical protein
MHVYFMESTNKNFDVLEKYTFLEFTLYLCFYPHWLGEFMNA